MLCDTLYSVLSEILTVVKQLESCTLSLPPWANNNSVMRLWFLPILILTS